MAEIQYKGYSIILKDEIAHINGIDSLEKYDIIYSDDSEYAPTSFIGIVAETIDFKRTIGISASMGATGLHADSYIIYDDKILICCSDYIFCLHLTSLDLIWKIKADVITCFGIYMANKTIIIHGELEISCIDIKGEIKWQKSGTDIFVTNNGNTALYIEDNYIFAEDWSEKKYKFDLKGNSA
ncbi:hypothetical protein [Flavobacterium arcticum]|nr:hypothetical protein [Flavobacterium arcticum]